MKSKKKSVDIALPHLIQLVCITKRVIADNSSGFFKKEINYTNHELTETRRNLIN